MDIEVDVSSVVLETPRLILRPWLQEDLADFYAYASVPGVGEMAGWPHHTDIEVTRHILQSFIDHKNCFALVHKADDRVIGSFGLEVSWGAQEPLYAPLRLKELGYVLSRDYWGCGLMPEAALEVIRYCFDTYSLDALTCGCFTLNTQSRRVIEKCGFTLIKQGNYYSQQLSKNYDELQYLLPRSAMQEAPFNAK